MKKQETNQIPTWYEKKSKRKFSGGGSGPKSKKNDVVGEKKDSQKKSSQKTFVGYKKNQQKKNVALPDFVTEIERLFDLASVPDDAKKILSDFPLPRFFRPQGIPYGLLLLWQTASHV